MPEKIDSRVKAFGEIVFEFPVLHAGWDLDNVGWIVRGADRTLHIILTTHGTPYVAMPQELSEKIGEYYKAIQMTNKAINLLLPTPLQDRLNTTDRPSHEHLWHEFSNAPVFLDETSRIRHRVVRCDCGATACKEVESELVSSDCWRHSPTTRAAF